MDSDTNATRGRPPAPRMETRREQSSTISSPRADQEMTYVNHSQSNRRPIDRRDEILNSCQMPPRPHFPPRSLSPMSQSSTDKPFQPRNRTEILASRVLSMDEYLREIKGPKQSRRPNGTLAKIPVPLLPGETMEEYEQEFSRWLNYRHTSASSLRFKPLKERVYSHQFAYQRVLKRTASKLPHIQTHPHSSIPKAKNDVQDTHSRGEGTHNTAKAALSTKLTAKSSRPKEAPENKTERASHDTSCALSQTNTSKSDQAASESRHSGSNTPNTSTQTPTAISQKDIQVVHEPAETETKREKEQTTNARHALRAEALTTKLLVNSDGSSDTPMTDEPSEDNLPSWALQLVSNVQKLEAKVTQLQRQVDSYPCCQGEVSSTPVDPARKLEPPESSQVSTVENPSNGTSFSGNSENKLKDVQAKSDKLNASGAEVVQDASAAWIPAKENTTIDDRKEKAVVKQLTCEDIHREATRILARAVQARVHEDSKKRQLTEAYDHLNEQILMNETAINDALDYIKAIKDVDEAIAMEQHGQIMELVVSINKEKEKRASALAALIVYNFIDKQDALVSLLEQEPPGEGRNRPNHDELGAISSQIEQKDNVLETLEMHLNEQLQWVTGLPPCVSEADKILCFKALRKMSKRLMKEQTAKELLEHQRNEMLNNFIQDDPEIRKLVKGARMKQRTL